MFFGFDDPAFLGSLSIYDPDALAYIRAVEIADSQELEPSVRAAINDFVIGCKTDATWNAIKACCILVGARTLPGCLVPVVGPAPTSYNFVPPDYDRKTGLVGDGATTFLSSNRDNSADPQNNKHLAVWAQSAPTTNNAMFIGAGGSTGAAGSAHINISGGNATTIRSRFHAQTLGDKAACVYPTFIGASRSNSTSYSLRHTGGSTTFAINSQTPLNGNIRVFVTELLNYSNARIAFYSIGESLNLALLDARVTTLINAIGAAIP
jgi:hypothetical protein